MYILLCILPLYFVLSRFKRFFNSKKAFSYLDCICIFWPSPAPFGKTYACGNICTTVNWSRFEVLSAETTQFAVSWDIRAYDLVDRYQHFGGTCCLHLAG
jgi:hypothetical protein